MRDVWAFNDRIERLPTQLRCLHNGYNAGSEITIFTCMHGLALSDVMSIEWYGRLRRHAMFNSFD